MAFLSSKGAHKRSYDELVPEKPLPVPSSPATINLRQLAEDPEIAAATDLLGKLREAAAQFEHEKERLDLEYYFGEGRQFVEGASDGPRDVRLRERLKVLQAQAPTMPTSSPSGAHPDNDIASALSLIAGAPIPPSDDRSARRREIARKIATIDMALRKQQLLYHELVADKSHAISDALRPQHDALLVEIFQAAQKLSRLVDDERDFRASVIVRGYDPSAEIIGPLNSSAALILGSERQYDSEISRIRRQLEDRGLLK